MAKTRRRPVSTDKRFRKNSNKGDYGTPERWQHSGRVMEIREKGGIVAARATEEHVIDGMVLCGLLDKTQSNAAFKLKLDFHLAGLAASVTSRYNAHVRIYDHFTNKRDRSDAEEAAYRRWRHAVREMGLAYSCAVISTVCHDETPAPADIPLLQKGLDQLVEWYGLKKTEEKKTTT